MSDPDPEFGVALIGYGLAGASFHAPLIRSTPGLRLAAIVTSDAERVRSAQRDHPGARVVPNTDLLWEESDDIDLVVVATPNRTHVPLARRAIEAGAAVVVDKPLAARAEEARLLMDAARRRGVLLTVYQNRRWDGDFLTVQRLLREGTLGTVSRFESRFERWRPVPKPGWRQSPAAEDAGGLLYDLGSHLIDQALVLFGPAEHVYAELDRTNPRTEVDDDVFVALTHRSGVRSHLWMSTAAAQPGPRMRVFGSRGAYTKFGLDVQEAALRSGARPGGPGWGEEAAGQWGVFGADDDLRPVRTEAGRYPDFYAGLVQALRDDGPPPVDPDDTVRVLEVIQAAQRSSAERAVVRLG